MKTVSLRTKLTLLYTVLLATLLTGVGAIYYQTLTTRLERQLSEELLERSSAKGLTLDQRLQPEVEIRGDSTWLERVILNLLDNAIKFTPRGGLVSVRLRTEDGHARLEVHDTGSGISAETLPHIFERFYRSDASRSREIEGAGLGLSLVKWIVEQHHGRIDVESDPGAGSCFTVRLPLPPHSD